MAQNLISLNGHSLANAFGLGRVIDEPVCVAAGWGGHNRLWRLVTTTGSWAIKEVRRDLPASAHLSFAIECEAVTRGIPAPEPRATVDGDVYAHVDRAVVRCHRWVDGHAKTNETVTVEDAAAMGGIVAALHGLRIAVPADPSEPSGGSFGEDHWIELAQRGEAVGAVWAQRVRANIVEITAIESVLERAAPPRDRVGSHCDLNAHNVLFGRRLMLIDWDAANAADPGFERASYAALWGSSASGPPALDRTVAFLRGYLAAGGALEVADVDSLDGGMRGLVNWTEQNLQLALRGIGDDQHNVANMLINAVLNAPRTIEERRAHLQRCYAEALS